MGVDGWKRNVYVDKTGHYVVEPYLEEIVGGAQAALVDPATGRPVRMTIDPAAGAVRFSKPLLNVLAPANPTGEAAISDGGGPGFPVAGAVDVFVLADYHPFAYRISRGAADDDSPSAYLDAFGRTAVFWQRRHAASEPPHFGARELMYRTHSRSIQVARPPMAGGVTVESLGPGGAWGALAPADYVVDAANGVIALPWDADGVPFRITYTPTTPPGLPLVEIHTPQGWSIEQVIPIDTVVSEGPVMVAQETYPFSAPFTGGVLNVVRYWVFWSSTRPRYDPNMAPGPDGTLGAGSADDIGAIVQTSDVHYTTVNPCFGAGFAESRVTALPAAP